MFINAPSLVIVVGGSIAACMMQFTMPQFVGALKSAGIAFMYKEITPLELVNAIDEAAIAVRKDGLLALEPMLEAMDDPFMKEGLQMGVDGQDARSVENHLTSEMNNSIGRHEVGQGVFKALGDLAPAMGMVGTLIGLVQMLANMSDPAAIGPAMAVALLTTLYGALVANLIAIPIGAKLQKRTEQERINKSLVIEGVIGIMDGVNPKLLKPTLLNYLPSKDRAVNLEG